MAAWASSRNLRQAFWLTQLSYSSLKIWILETPRSRHHDDLLQLPVRRAAEGAELDRQARGIARQGSNSSINWLVLITINQIWSLITSI